MDKFSSDGVEIAYSVQGEGKPALLLHGFCGTAADNFVRTGWVGVLARAGRQTIMMDMRGHGESEKLYDPEAYSRELMAQDALNLLDHLGIKQADLVGFSMGGVVSLQIAQQAPDRLTSLSVLGVGDAFYGSEERRGDSADALEAESIDGSHSERAKQFRLYAESLGQDLKAVAACSRAPRGTPDKNAIAGLSVPLLLLAGSRDATAGGLSALEETWPNARCVILPGVTHDKTLSHGMVKMEVVEFLEGQ